MCDRPITNLNAPLYACEWQLPSSNVSQFLLPEIPYYMELCLFWHRQIQLPVLQLWTLNSSAKSKPYTKRFNLELYISATQASQHGGGSAGLLVISPVLGKLIILGYSHRDFAGSAVISTGLLLVAASVITLNREFNINPVFKTLRGFNNS